MRIRVRVLYPASSCAAMVQKSAYVKKNMQIRFFNCTNSPPKIPYEKETSDSPTSACKRRIEVQGPVSKIR
jgi:hypothetical protein